MDDGKITARWSPSCYSISKNLTGHGPSEQVCCPEELCVVSKCANPNCSIPFLHLRKGALFAFEINSGREPTGHDESLITLHKGQRRLETFWLCDHCSSRFMIRMIRNKAQIVRRDVAAPGISPHSRSELSERAEARSAQMSQTDSEINSRRRLRG